MRKQGIKLIMAPVLGRGRFSSVITDPKNAGNAIKIIDVDDQIPPHNWKAEISALKQLRDSPNVLQLLEVVEPDRRALEPQCRIITPLYALTLEHIIYEYAKAQYPPGSGWRNVMSEERASSILAGIARALAATHSLGIIHRDLKPENILFTARDSEPVLADFGIAWVPGYGENPRVCDVATGLYKAPELLYGLEYDKAVDIWAMGCIYARLLGPDCKPLFAPYTSDVALVGVQVQTLGSPNMQECPTLNDTLAERITPGITGSYSFPNALGRQLLSYEPTARPTAQAVVEYLKKY